jgi:hypothetical protein
MQRYWKTGNTDGDAADTETGIHYEVVNTALVYESAPFYRDKRGKGMDSADALRIVIFEYLLPDQRRARVKVIREAFASERVDMNWTPSRHPAGIFEDLLRISEQLLHSQGLATAYTYPWTMHHENGQIDDRRNISALVDSEGPFVWNPTFPRRADPLSGIRVFRAGDYMCSGRLP